MFRSALFITMAHYMAGDKRPRAVHCPTRAQFLEVVAQMVKEGYGWEDGKAEIRDNWDDETNCIDLDNGYIEYADMKDYEKLGFKIISYEEFFRLEQIDINLTELNQYMDVSINYPQK